MDCSGRVLSIQSHVVSGYVGNKCAAFLLQLLEFQVDFINSVQLSNHTGYSHKKGQILDSDQLESLYQGLKLNNLHKNYSHVLTGYIGNVSFLKKVAEIVKDLKKENPGIIYVCDPVMGDNNKMYVPDELLPVYKEEILPLANIITPNQFEIELLTNKKIETVEHAREAMQVLHQIGAKCVMISSAILGNESLLVCLGSRLSEKENKTLRIDIPKLPVQFTGSGDVFAALLLAWSQRIPDDFKVVVEKVISTLQAVLRRTLDYAESVQSTLVLESMSPRLLELKLIQSKKDIEQPPQTFTANYI